MLVTTVEAARDLQHLLVESGRDAELGTRLSADPRKMLAAAGVILRSDIEVRPVECTAEVLYVALPVAPEEGAVLDNELDAASGGVTPTIALKAASPLIVMGTVVAIVAIEAQVYDGPHIGF